jgi:pimeloyl-ACP methyl ester carboxylesterase
MFSETRYARNGDLRVAYRTSRDGPRDIVFIPNWFTCCEHLPELPSLQGWVEAMTSLGRLIFFDQPGTGASDPVKLGALPTLEQWADSITAVLDDLGSREAVLVAIDGAFATGALFAAAHPSRTTALVALEVDADLGHGLMGPHPEDFFDAMVAVWGTGEFQRVLNPDMPWNEEIRATWARMERLAASPATVAGMMPLVSEVDVRAVLPAVRVPTLVVQHTDDPFTSWQRWASTSLITSRTRSTLSCLAATSTTSSSRGASPSRRSPSSSPGTKQKWPMIGFLPRCCSPT